MDDQAEKGSRSPRPWTAVALVALAVVAAVPIIAGAAIGPSNSSQPSATSASLYKPLASPATATTTATPARPKENLPPGSGALVAAVLHQTPMRDAPGGKVLAQIGTRTQFGSPEILLVVKHSPRWLGVVTPDAGNGRVGWIPRAAASLSRVNWELKVSLATHTVSVLQAGKVLHRYDVAIGRASAPTPTGRFAVTDRLTTGDPSGPYGCCILALSAKAPHAIQGWNGGDRIAIHSTPDTGSIGLPVSHGCLRLTLAEGRWLIDHIPLGTPTIISSA